MKRTIIRLGVSGALALAAPALTALGTPGQASAVRPDKPGIAAEAATLRSIAAPPAVAVEGSPPQIEGVLRVVDGSRLLATKDPWSTIGTQKTYQWFRDGVAIPGATARRCDVKPPTSERNSATR